MRLLTSLKWSRVSSPWWGYWEKKHSYPWGMDFTEQRERRRVVCGSEKDKRGKVEDFPKTRLPSRRRGRETIFPPNIRDHWSVLQANQWFFLRAPSAFAFSLSLVSCFIFWRRKISTTHCICYFVDGGFRHFGLTNFTLTPPPPLTLFPPVLTFLSPFWTWQFQTAILTTWDHVFLTYFKHAPKSLDTKFLSC